MMDNLYQIYKYDFHKAMQHTIQAEADGTDGTLTLSGKSRLEEWLDLVADQTKDYMNESEIPKRRNKARR